MFGALLGALKGVGSGIGKGIKSMGQNLAGGAFGGGGFDWNKMGEAMQGFGQGAQMVDPNSQLGAAASGIGGGVSKFGQKKAAQSNAITKAEGMTSDQIMKSQNAPIAMADAGGMGELTPLAPSSPMQSGMTPPTDDGMWERDSGGWRRKEGAKPLMY